LDDSVIRECLQAVMARHGVAAPELAKAIGYDKGYFVDYFAGRKKSITAAAFMLASRHLGVDPWALAGIAAPVQMGKPETEVAGADEISPDQDARVDDISSVAALGVSGVVEEMVYRAHPMPAVPSSVSLPVLACLPAARQSVYEVRGADYELWGIKAGSLLHTLSYARYEAIASPGKLLVERSVIEGGLVCLALRRVVVDDDGAMFLQSPSGTKAPYPGGDRDVAGMVVNEQRGL
jgi:hypothetical protein